MVSPVALTGTREVAEDRVVLQQVRERCGVGDVVDGDDVDVVVRQRGAHDVAADAPESVDADLDGHSSSEVRTTETDRRIPL